ncbi:MAG: DNA repair protein RecO [Candidatus Gottesmanbacteria bacterium]|nr:DNA repair protein RecO [Candidatus Gottesmanbacteria bacterium]
MRSPHVYTTEGIVLKRRNVGETDRILTLFTRQYGKVGVLARGVRKVSSRRAPHIEVFNRVIATLHKGNGPDTLIEVSPIASYEMIRRDLGRVGAAYYLCELIDGLLPVEQVHEDVFMLLCDAFAALSTVKKERIEVLRERFAALRPHFCGPSDFWNGGKILRPDHWTRMLNNSWSDTSKPCGWLHTSTFDTISL